ncbi:MAG TPA: LysR family transcriptional regulator [Kiloniellaceae bacterium]|nr:LysR family transcriptional regulator [Kiloniellaceae bacterium]
MNSVMYYSSMNRLPMNWDDLRVFLALVESGSLSAAARALGLSQPTVGRRIQALEHALDERLFDRLPRGYVPTAAARALLPMAQAMAQAAEAVDRRRAVSDTLEGSVRISAGAAMSRFLCNRVAVLLDGLPGLDLELAASSQFSNLSRREADIAIRNRMPERGDLMARKVTEPAVAVYASRDYVARNKVTLSLDDPPGPAWSRWDWVDYDEARQHLSTAQWLAPRLGGAKARVACSTPAEKLDAIRGGGGLGLLSCYSADTEADLQRLTDPVDELRGETWMVVHQDLRDVPRIRTIADRVVALIHDNAALFAGRRQG